MARNFRACVTAGAATNACAALDGNKAFSNNEGRLPKVALNQSYQEARVGTDRQGAGGVRRLVFLIGGGAKSSVVSQYYTDDHYVTFCKMN